MRQSYLPLLPFALRIAARARQLCMVARPRPNATKPPDLASTAPDCPPLLAQAQLDPASSSHISASCPPRAQSTRTCTAPCTNDACHSRRLLLMSSRNNRSCHHFARSQVVAARTTHAMEEGEAVRSIVEGEARSRAWLPETCCLELNARRCQGRARGG